MTNEMEFDPHVINLTPRGKEIFQLILKGLSDKQIGEYLGISYSGVRRHKEKMILANGCNSILELVSKYYELRDNTHCDEQGGTSHGS